MQKDKPEKYELIEDSDLPFGDNSGRGMEIKRNMRKYFYDACLIGLGVNLVFVLCDFSLYRIIHCLLWLAGAYALTTRGEKLYKLFQYLWGMLIAMHIFDIFFYSYDLYGRIKMILNILSAVLMAIFWTQKRMSCSHKSILYTGLGMYALEKIMTIIGVTKMTIEWFPGYLDPCYSILRSYIMILAYVMLGIVTWMQRDR